MNEPLPESTVTDRAHRVLAVDDEALARTLLQRHLTKDGHDVVAVGSVAQAQVEMKKRGVESFHCVVTDYQMPEQDGLELLAWIKEQDPSLSVIMVTAQGERSMVTQTLRGGALDFLDKPVAPDDLRRAVGRGIQTTRNQRHLKETATEVAELGDLQELLVGLHSARFLEDIHLHYHPKHQAGGDFACYKKLPDGRKLIVVADVSGHDLKAAYVSAYFQGLFHGMIESGRSVADIFEYFNHWLIAEAARENSSSPRQVSSTSLSVCGVVIDERANSMTVINHGSPIPLLVQPIGESVFLGEAGGWPLGWFPEAAVHRQVWPLETGRLYFWTDGLEDIAAGWGVSPIAVATRMELLEREKRPNDWIKQAPDDVMLLVVDVEPATSLKETRFEPLICERYRGNQLDEIDALQLRWQRSLEFAVPSLDRTQLYDLLLCGREAVINALLHGCQKNAGLECSVQIHYEPVAGIMRLRICDPGPGHDFNHEAHGEWAAREMIDQHRGLTLMHRMASRIATKRNGADLTMDFHCASQATAAHPVL